MGITLGMEKAFKQRLMNKKLIHAITNAVTMRDMANAILAVGGSPMMADSPLEIEEITELVDATVINLGMLNASKEESIRMILHATRSSIVLDPVGVTISSYRKKFAIECLKTGKISVLKGNRSEILALAGVDCASIGVDSLETQPHDLVIYTELAAKYQVIVVVTDKEDIITDGINVAIVDNGSKMLKRITGAGCMLGGIIGVMIAQNTNAFESVLCAVLMFDIASENAHSSVNGETLYGSFSLALFDALGSIKLTDIITSSRVTMSRVTR